MTESDLLAEKYSRETSSQRNLPTIFYTDLGTLDSAHVLRAFSVKNGKFKKDLNKFAIAR